MHHLFGFHFGPDNSYFAYTPQGWQSQGIPREQLPALIADAASTEYPRTSVGVGGTYVSVSADGRAWRWLDGKYPELEEVLRAPPGPIEVVAINPYVAGQFMIIYKNGGGYRCRLPLVYRDKVAEFIAQGMLPMIQQAAAQQAQTQNFLLNLMMNRPF